MNKYIPFLLVAILGIGSLAASQANAQSPDDVFDECTRSIARLTKRCQNAIGEVVEDCVPLIKRLLNAGHRERARAVADRCIDRINAIHRECQEELRERCASCIRRLLAMGARDLARELRNRCERASNLMQETRERAVATIRGLF